MSMGINPETVHPHNVTFYEATLFSIEQFEVLNNRLYMPLSPGRVANMMARWFVDGFDRPELTCMQKEVLPPEDDLRMPSIIVPTKEKQWLRQGEIAEILGKESVADVVRLAVYTHLGAVANNQACALRILENVEQDSGFHINC